MTFEQRFEGGEGDGPAALGLFPEGGVYLTLSPETQVPRAVNSPALLNVLDGHACTGAKPNMAGPTGHP